ncbi:hypothetical protein ACGP04_14365 [Piscirickettsia salmonis]|uniref:hypothetical protein n=1 Tax=Piscirickettsia salmonis TaxID=1238 RepID=UPI000F094C91|nr:hypothetical protein DA717_01010 [Piscirickettsiaceae bacterium NZ-RLO2]
MKNLVYAQRLLYFAVLIAVIVTFVQPFLMPVKLADVPLMPLVVASIYSLIFAAALALSAYKLPSKAGWPRFLLVILFIGDAMPAVKNWLVLWHTTELFAIIYLMKLMLMLAAILLSLSKLARDFYKC